MTLLDVNGEPSRIDTRRQIGLLGLTQPLTQGIGVVVSFILARNLMPRDYGLVAMAAGFTGILATVSGLGLTDAAVRRKELSTAQASALFWLNVGVGILFGLGCLISGPMLQNYFDESVVTTVAAWAGFALFLNSAGNQHRIQVLRQGRYGAVAEVELITQFIAGVCAITFAVFGGAWRALIALFVFQAAGRTIALWIVSGWIPRLFKRQDIPWDTLTLGAIICAGWVLNALSATAEAAVLGKLKGATDLGLYTKSSQLARYPIMVVFIPAFLPAIHRLAKFQDQPALIAPELVRMIWWVLLIVSLPIGLLAGSAADFIPLVMGEQWASLEYLTLIILVGAFAVPVAQAAYWPLTALAQRRALVKLQIVSSAIPIVVSLVGAFIGGAIGMSMAYSFAIWFILVPVSLRLISKTLSISSFPILRVCFIVFLVTTMTGLWTRLLLVFVHKIGGNGRFLPTVVSLLGGFIFWTLATNFSSKQIFREILETVAEAVGIANFKWVKRSIGWLT